MAEFEAPVALFELGGLVHIGNYLIVLPFDGDSPTYSLERTHTDGPRVSKRRQLSQQTRGLDPILFQCWSSAVCGGSIVERHWVKASCWLSSTQVSVYTHTSPPQYIRQLIRVLLAGQPANHKLTTILEIEI